MTNILEQLEQSPTALFRCCEILEGRYKNLTFDIDSLNNDTGYIVAKMDSGNNKLVVEKEFYSLKVGTWSVLDVILQFINNGNLWLAANTIYEVLGVELPYIRVGVNWFKISSLPDRYGISRETLLPWNILTLKQDHGKDCVFDLPKYDTFTMSPDNLNYNRSIDGAYNQYAPFEHQASMGGSWDWTEYLLKHIFGDQYEIGLQYMQCLYTNPRQVLPILVLASEKRATGKSTFLNYLDILFGANMVVINPQDISSSFNDSYGLKNIIGIEESKFDSIQTTEKLKAINTQSKMLINPKGVTPYSVPFFGKLVILTNDEHKFTKVDEAEVRYWIRKIPPITKHNTNILEDLKAEIPHFLHHLQEMPALDLTRDRAVFTPDQLETELLKEVKNESMTPLYKSLYEYMERIFNHDKSLHQMEFIPLDLKEKFFQNNNSIDSSYIRTVLKKEFHLESGKNRKYRVLDESDLDKKTGQAFTISRDYFNLPEAEYETDTLPF